MIVDRAGSPGAEDSRWGRVEGAAPPLGRRAPLVVAG